MEKNLRSLHFLSILAGFDLKEYQLVYDKQYDNKISEATRYFIFQHLKKTRRFICFILESLMEPVELFRLKIFGFKTDQEIPETDLYKYTQYEPTISLKYIKLIKQNGSFDKWIELSV